MSYPRMVQCHIEAGAGLALSGQLINSAGVPIGGAITNFDDDGNGFYSRLVTIPDNFVGKLPIKVAGVVVAQATFDPLDGERLGTIQSAIAGLGGAMAMRYFNVGSAAGSWTIIAGDDCLEADGRNLYGDIQPYAGPDLAVATAVLRILDKRTFDGATNKAQLEVAATITVIGNRVRLSADLTAVQTAALAPAAGVGSREYACRFVVTLGGHHMTLCQGKLTVAKQLDAPLVGP